MSIPVLSLPDPIASGDLSRFCKETTLSAAKAAKWITSRANQTCAFFTGNLALADFRRRQNRRNFQLSPSLSSF